MTRVVVPENCYIMRHAQVTGDIEQDPVVSPYSESCCRRNVAELAKKIKGSDVVILYSPQKRAEYTAMIAKDELENRRVTVAASSAAGWLNSDRKLITENMILRTLEGYPGKVLLLISHEPDIAQYLKIFTTISHSTIFGSDAIFG